jgi:glycosyltransferase involved in cell wall biosynthesis
MIQKKVVHIVPRYTPSLGGVETHVSAVNAQLVQRGYEVVVLTTQHEPQLLEEEIVAGVQVYRLPFAAINKKLQTWMWLWNKRTIITDKQTVVHVHDVAWWLLPFVFILYKKFYITFHGWEGVYPVPFFNKLQRYLFGQCAQKKIHVGAYIQKFYWDTPNLVVYGGTTCKNTVQKHKKNKLGATLHCVFLGRLEKENEIEKYFELLTELKLKGLTIAMTWVGDGAFRSRCEEFGLVTGMVTNPTKYIADANIVFAASYLSLLEAQAQSKIVVSLYTHPLKKSYLESYPGRAALLIANSPVTVAAELTALISDSERMYTLEQDAYTFASKMTWKKLTEQYIELWNSDVR